MSKSTEARGVPAILVHCSCPDQEVAARIARALVEEHLAACVQAIPGVVSTYRWNGAVHVDPEVVLVIKTVRAKFDAIRLRVLDMHPYELPEIIAVDIGAGHAPYLDWIAHESTATDRLP